MSYGINQVNLIGNLGIDPETRYTESGLAVCTVSVGCSEKRKAGDHTEWVRIVAFGKLAEIMSQYLAKGSQIYVSGKLQTRDYEKNGEKRYITEVIANEMRMLGRKPEAKPEPAALQDDNIPF